MTGSRRTIPIARPLVGDAEASAAADVIRSGWLTQGPEVAAFEREVAQYVGAPYACAVSSCSTALHLALRAVGVGPGDEVITVSHSFIATANSVRLCGATPVFVDVEPSTFNIDPALIEAAVTARSRAILCVHQLGMPCDLAAVLEIAARRSLRVVEDAACAIGSEIRRDGRWERIGRPHGDIACFSFHPRKLVTTGDGGMLTTRSAEYDAQCRRWRQHGMTVSDAARHAARAVVFESYEDEGYNYRLTDVQAAVGRRQLLRLPKMLARRRELAARYGDRLRAAFGVTPPEEPRVARSNWQSYAVWLHERIDQRVLMQTLLDAGISTRRGVMCAHREPAFASIDHGPLPNSERAQDRTILLPLFAELSDADQDYVVDQLTLAASAQLSEHVA